MSRIDVTGVNPDTGKVVDVSYGWDEVPLFTPGYFFQVFSRDKKEIEDCPSGEGLLVNEGFLEGISTKELKSLKRKWKVKS